MLLTLPPPLPLPFQMGDDRELARHLALEGARLVLLGVPPGTEFGIDVNYWNVGVKFKGVKMIPPGLHFVYYR